MGRWMMSIWSMGRFFLFQKITSFRWYYRNEQEWKSVFAKAKLSVEEQKEIIHPITDENFSVIYVLRV